MKSRSKFLMTALVLVSLSTSAVALDASASSALGIPSSDPVVAQLRNIFYEESEPSFEASRLDGQRVRCDRYDATGTRPSVSSFFLKFTVKDEMISAEGDFENFVLSDEKGLRSTDDPAEILVLREFETADKEMQLMGEISVPLSKAEDQSTASNILRGRNVDSYVACTFVDELEYDTGTGG